MALLVLKTTSASEVTPAPGLLFDFILSLLLKVKENKANLKVLHKNMSRYFPGHKND